MGIPRINPETRRSSTPNPGQGPPPNVLLINVFEVRADREEEFLQGWEAARDFMQRQPGYVSTRLHRSLDPAALFRFVNVAEWETPAAFEAAVRHPEFVKLRDASPTIHHASLYEVVRTSATRAPRARTEAESLVDAHRQTRFQFYPSDYLFGVIDSPDEAEDALRELLEAGLPPEGLATWRGEEGAATIDPTGSGHGIAARLWRVMQQYSDDGELIQRYAEETRRGRVAIGVHLPGGRGRERAQRILQAHAAHLISFVGPMTVEMLNA